MHILKEADACLECLHLDDRVVCLIFTDRIDLSELNIQNNMEGEEDDEEEMHMNVMHSWKIKNNSLINKVILLPNVHKYKQTKEKKSYMLLVSQNDFTFTLLRVCVNTEKIIGEYREV